jgi:tetratricopeptide (TPR) repeat protein
MASSASSSASRPKASTSVPPSTKPPQTGAVESAPFLERMEKYRKPISYGLGALAVLAIGIWLFRETGRRKATAAAEALDAARSSFESGNLPAASTEFQRVIQAYGGTDAAYQAELGLNAVRLASGQSQLAIDELRKFASANPPAFYAGGAWLMMGGALENLKKFDEASAAYLKAADVAPEAYRQVEALLGAARAYHLAGKEKEDLEVLRRIVSKYPEDTPGVPEAKVRLAERTRGAS